MPREIPAWAVLLVGLGGLLALSGSARASVRGDSADPNAPGPKPEVPPAMDQTQFGQMDAWAVEALDPSPQLLAWLRARERLLLTKTDLGDGGFTIGYGHFERAGSNAADTMPDTITPADAEALFAQDVQIRAVANVRRYILVPLTQNQFDALVSLAFNLSPNAFSQIANSVNVGEGLDPIVYSYVRAGTQFEAGLRARRDAEVAMFDRGSYA